MEEKLKSGETPYLVCRLGELKKNPRLMEKAWEISGHRYARAQRDLGDYYYDRNQFAQCKEHYTLAVGLSW